MYAAWLDDFASRGVSAIGFGVITLQRPVGEREPFVDLTEATGPVTAPMGPHVLSGLRARTWLAEHDDDELLAVAWRCADDVAEERHGRPGDEEPAVIQLRQGVRAGSGGPARHRRRRAASASATASLPAGVALDAIAELLGEDAGAVREAAVPLLRGLVADGLLV